MPNDYQYKKPMAGLAKLGVPKKVKIKKLSQCIGKDCNVLINPPKPRCKPCAFDYANELKKIKKKI